MGNLHASRARILDHGLALSTQTGLNGVTLGVLADLSGMSKSGLFAHFKSKDEVQISLLNHSAELAKTQIVEPAMKAPPGLPRLKTVIARWFGWTKHAGLPGGCPVAAGMFEFDDAAGPVRDHILLLEREWETILEALVNDAIEHRHFKASLNPGQFVWELCGIYLAHHTSYRFAKSPDADKRANAAIHALLQRATTNPPTRFTLISTKD